MKYAKLFLLCLIITTWFSTSAQAQTTWTFYGQPMTVHGGSGDITCADNDKVCCKVTDPKVQEEYRSGGPTSTGDVAQAATSSLTAAAPPKAPGLVTVTAFTANGPITFQAAAGYSVSHGGNGTKTYHFKKAGPAHRVQIID